MGLSHYRKCFKCFVVEWLKSSLGSVSSWDLLRDNSDDNEAALLWIEEVVTGVL